MIKLCKLPDGSPCMFIGKLKIYLGKSWAFDWDNLHQAFYLDLGPIRVKLKKNYKGHSIY